MEVLSVANMTFFFLFLSLHFCLNKKCKSEKSYMVLFCCTELADCFHYY